MSEKIKKILSEYVEKPENIEELKENSDDLENIIQDLNQAFSSKRTYYIKIMEILNLFTSKLGISFLLLLNTTPLLKSILEHINNTNQKLTQSEKKCFFEIWKFFYVRFQKFKSLEIPELNQFYDLTIFIRSAQFQGSNYSEESLNYEINLTNYEKLLIKIIVKQVETEQILNKMNLDKKTDSKILFELLKGLKSIDQSELFSSDISEIETNSLIPFFKKTEKLKESIKIRDKSIENLLYGQEKTLHNQEFYIEGTEHIIKNDLQTHFLESYYCFYEPNLSKLQELVCGFLNAKGGRIYIGLNSDKIEGVKLSKKDQDNLRMQIDELVRNFHPTVQQEEFRTYFYPVFDKYYKSCDKFIVKIIINPLAKDTYFTPKPYPYVYLREADGKEIQLNGSEWQALWIEKNSPEYINSFVPINDPKPATDYEEYIHNNYENNSNRKLVYNHQYFDPEIEREQRVLNKIMYSNEKNNENKILEKDIKDLIKIGNSNGEKKTNQQEKESSQKKNEKDIKLLNILNDEIDDIPPIMSEKKQKNNRDYENYNYKVLFLKYDYKISEKNFVESTITITEHIKNSNQLKYLIRRKEKKYFFIESMKEINDDVVDEIKEIYAQAEMENLKVGFANIKNYKKYQEYVIAK